jgi:hypothetical protein
MLFVAGGARLLFGGGVSAQASGVRGLEKKLVASPRLAESDMFRQRKRHGKRMINPPNIAAICPSIHLDRNLDLPVPGIKLIYLLRS